jgi:mannitol-specific phosphotransferase system IIBC component
MPPQRANRMDRRWMLWALAWLVIPGSLLSILLIPWTSHNDKWILLGVYAIVVSFISVVVFMKWFWERKERQTERKVNEYTLLRQEEQEQIEMFTLE